ncbi:MAG: hypothetical protein ACREJY_15240 [Candidatus Rokuibacteriota bacterium]
MLSEGPVAVGLLFVATVVAMLLLVLWGAARLLNVVVHAQLSAPTPWRIFDTDPLTTFIADWPYVWLPGFLVPLAWLLHAVSLRQLRSRR